MSRGLGDVYKRQAVKRDVELVKWFVQDMKHLFNDDRVEILINNKDLGVFEQ